MRKIFAFLATAATIAAVSCSDDPDGPKMKLEAQSATLASAQYYGETNVEGVAKYDLTIGVEYKEVVSRAESAKKANESISLTFYAERSMDPNEAALKEGEYTVATAVEANKIGPAKISTTYKDETENTVNIKSGTVKVAKNGDGYVLTLDLKTAEDEVVAVTYTGAIVFENKSTEKFLSLDFQRFYYWGEDQWDPGYAIFLVTLSAGEFDSSSDPAEIGATILEFYYIDEPEEYAIDAKIRPGKYYVNTDYDYVPGTLYQGDPDDDYYMGGTVIETVDKVGNEFVSETNYIVGGFMEVIGDAEGNPKDLYISFVLDNGEEIGGRYKGAFKTVDEVTVSTIREDHNSTNFVAAQMLLHGQDTWRYENAGTHEWEIILLGEGITIDPQGNLGGKGDLYQLSFASAPTVTDALPLGTYEIKPDTWDAGTSQAAQVGMASIGFYMGNWYFVPDFAKGEYATIVPGMKGSITISKNTDDYVVEVDMIDDAKNKITAKYVGALPVFDDREESAGTSSVLRTSAFLPQQNFGIDTNASPAYKNARMQKIQAAKKLSKAAQR